MPSRERRHALPQALQREGEAPAEPRAIFRRELLGIHSVLVRRPTRAARREPRPPGHQMPTFTNWPAVEQHPGLEFLHSKSASRTLGESSYGRLLRYRRVVCDHITARVIPSAATLGE